MQQIDSGLSAVYDQTMKTLRRPAAARRSPSPRRLAGQANLDSETYTLSHAKAYLGRLIEKAEQGRDIFIVRGRKRFCLQFVPEIEPIPIRPPGYFQLDAEDIALDKQFSAANVIPRPDLD